MITTMSTLRYQYTSPNAFPRWTVISRLLLCCGLWNAARLSCVDLMDSDSLGSSSTLSFPVLGGSDLNRVAQVGPRSREHSIHSKDSGIDHLDDIAPLRSDNFLQSRLGKAFTARASATSINKRSMGSYKRLGDSRGEA